MKKIAIIGASYLQEPLIERAKEMNLETHVFAWACGDIGEQSADFFYPISIVKKDEIAKKCQEIGIDGICTISTDLGAITVNYVAEKLGLIGNSKYCAEVSTNKKLMRECFAQNGDPSPKSVQIDMEAFRDILSDDSIDDFLSLNEVSYPVIVKPTDRSGSRGIFKLSSKNGLANAVKVASDVSFESGVLIEEFVDGQEYSVEYVTWNGKHQFLQLTKKYTTGEPHFVETGHLEPAPVSDEILQNVKKIVEHALSSLQIRYGASHSEIKITEKGEIKIIEIGGRMGGDFIGSSLVKLSTGVDFVQAVIEIALGVKPELKQLIEPKTAGIRFVLTEEDIETYHEIKKDPEIEIVYEEIHPIEGNAVMDSSTRHGCFLFASTDCSSVLKYLPEEL